MSEYREIHKAIFDLNVDHGGHSTNHRQPLLLVGLTLQASNQSKDVGRRNRGENNALPERCGFVNNKFAALLSFSTNAPTFFGIPLHRTVPPAIAHAGDRGSASSRIALPKPSRVDELPMSAHTKYGANQRVPQRVCWSFFDSRKSPVKSCEVDRYDTKRKTLIRQITACD